MKEGIMRKSQGLRGRVGRVPRVLRVGKLIGKSVG